MLRRSPKYRVAVAEFLRSVRARRKHLLKTLDFHSLDSHRLSTGQRLELWGRRALGLQEVLTAYQTVLKTYSLVKEQGRVANRAERPGSEDSPSCNPNRLRSTVGELVSRCWRSAVKFGRIAKRSSKENFPPLELPQRDRRPWYRNYNVFRNPGVLVFRCHQVFR